MRAIKKIIIIFIICMVPIIFVDLYPFPEPSQFVSNETFVKNSNPFFTYEVTKYPSKVEIITPQYEEGRLQIGFVVDKWNLNFGIIPLGNNEKRHLTIVNSEKNKVRVNLKVYGDINPLISFNENNFILSPNNSTYIDILLNTTEKTKPGNYTGEIDIIVKKSNLNFLNWML